MNITSTLSSDIWISSPLRYFNISECGTYSNIWVWDLALTCENSDVTSLESCACTSADILYQYGEVDCPGSDSPSCPDNCPVCNTCMLLLGCSPEDVQGAQRLPTQLQQEMTKALPIAIGVAAAVATLVAGVAIHQYKRLSIEGGGLGTEFIREEPPVNTML